METKVEKNQSSTRVNIETQTFVCENCGGVLKYDIESAKFRCSSCKAESDIQTLANTVEEYDFNQYHQREQSCVPFEGIAVVACHNCGYEITFDTYQIASVCPMCNSTQIAEVKQAAGIPPEGIIPFQISKPEATQRFKKWVKSRWFAPGDFKKKCGIGSLQGLYLPFWTYDAVAFSNYIGRGGKYRTMKDKEGKTYTVTDWTNVVGAVTKGFDDIQVCASQKGSEIECILPFHTTNNSKPFALSYLSGFYAELYAIRADQGFESAKKTMEQELHALAEQDIRRTYDVADVSSLTTRYCNVTYKHMLLPVWGSSYGYRGKTFHYYINGETGAVDGQRPYSVPKIIAAVAAAVAVIILLIVLFGG